MRDINTKFTIFMQTSETGWQRLCSKFLQIREREAVGILFIGLTADLRAVLQSCLVSRSC
jgi:hypothetical protein